MYQAINFNAFTDAFNAIRPDNFTYEGLRALYDHITEIEEDTGEEIELDVIALCCEFSEYSIEEFLDHYGEDREDDLVVVKFGDGSSSECNRYLIRE